MIYDTSGGPTSRSHVFYDTFGGSAAHYESHPSFVEITGEISRIPVLSVQITGEIVRTAFLSVEITGGLWRIPVPSVEITGGKWRLPDENAGKSSSPEAP